MGTYPKHIAPNTILKKNLRVDRLPFIEVPDCYRGTVAAGAATNGDTGLWAVGEALGVTAGADAYKNGLQTLSATNPLIVKNPQSLILYGTSFSTNATPVSYSFQITGFDWWGNPVTEQMQLQSATGATQAKPTQFVYSRVTGIVLNTLTIGGGVQNANGFLAIGHGKSLVNTSVLFRPRVIVSPLLTRPEIQGLPAASAPCGLGGLAGIAAVYDPNGAIVNLTTNTGANQQWDAAKGGVQIPDGTLLVAGEYTVHYNEGWLETV